MSWLCVAFIWLCAFIHAHQIAHLRLVNFTVCKLTSKSWFLKNFQKETKMSFMKVRVIYTFTRNAASCVSLFSEEAKWKRRELSHLEEYKHKCNFLCSLSKEVRLSSSTVFCVILEHVSGSLLKPLIKNIIVGFLLTWYFITGCHLLVNMQIFCVFSLRKAYSLKKMFHSIASKCACQKWRLYTLFYLVVMMMKFGEAFTFIICSPRGMFILKDEWHLPRFMSYARILYTLF